MNKQLYREHMLRHKPRPASSLNLSQQHPPWATHFKPHWNIISLCAFDSLQDLIVAAWILVSWKVLSGKVLAGRWRIWMIHSPQHIYEWLHLLEPSFNWNWISLQYTIQIEEPSSKPSRGVRKNKTQKKKKNHEEVTYATA